MSAIDPQLLQALRETLSACLYGGLALSALWGLWLLLAPGAARRFAAGADRWVGIDPYIERLNTPVGSTRFFYRYHRWAGALVVIGAGYALARWLLAYDRSALIGMLDPRLVSSGLDWLVPAAETVFVSFNAAILLFGLVVMFRPSLLKLPERWANRWVGVPAQDSLNRRFDPLAQVLDDHPRLVGGLVLTFCVGLLWQLLGIL